MLRGNTPGLRLPKRTPYEALATVMGGQQVYIQTFRPCNDGGVIVTTQYQIFFSAKSRFGAKLSREETQERATNVGPVKNKEKKRERKRGKEGSKDRSFCTHVRTFSFDPSFPLFLFLSFFLFFSFFLTGPTSVALSCVSSRLNFGPKSIFAQNKALGTVMGDQHTHENVHPGRS